MKKKITVTIECPNCAGTGIYSGMYEPEGTGVVCDECDGTGGKNFSYTPFTGRSHDRDHRVVVLNNRSDLGKTVTTYKPNDDYFSLTREERASQRWGIAGTVYDQKFDSVRQVLFLVQHADGPPVWYGRFELAFEK